MRVGLNGLRRYAQAVYASSDEYFAGLAPDDLGRVIDLTTMELGLITLSSVVSEALIAHLDSVRGEILCMKRLQEK